MALQRVSWACCLLLLVFLSPPRLALEEPEDAREGTCTAYSGGGKDLVTCREDWRQTEREGGGAVASVLGRQPQRLSVVESADVHISVKTAAKYHEGRLSLLLLTWLQTLQPRQVHIVTDEGANDHWTTTAEQLGFKVSTADGCSIGHCRECLCCKSGVEYNQFYRERESGSHYKWFCHVDDDVYVNIKQLVGVLQKYNPQTQKMYLGRWSLARTSKLQIARDIPNLKSKEFAFGTGALYCISSCLMTELETYLRGSQRFLSMCNLLQYTDDMTVGATIEAILGYNFTDVNLIFSELHATNHIPASELPSLISISYGKITLPADGREIKRHVKIPQPRFTLDEDPTRFLSFHCLLYPTTDWCQ